MQMTKPSMMQEHYFKKTPKIESSVSEVECYICGKGLQDGHCITAKTLPNGTALFCDLHYSLQ